MEIAFFLYQGTTDLIWLAYTANIVLIACLLWSRRSCIYEAISSLDKNERILLSGILISIFAIGIMNANINHFAAASEGWEDIYTGKQISLMNFSEMDHYRYGYAYPYTIAALFLVSGDIIIFSYFSLFCMLVSMIFIFLSAYMLTGKKSIAFASLAAGSTMYIVLKFTLVWQGKEIFLMAALSAYLFSLSLLYRKYDFKALLLSISLLFLLINIKYEMINVIYMIPLLLYVSRPSVRKIEKDILDRKDTSLLILTSVVIIFTFFGFLRYMNIERTGGAYPRGYAEFGVLGGESLRYLAENVSNIIEIFGINIIILLPLVALGVVASHRKFWKQISLVLFFGLLCLLPYLIHYPFLAEERYLISFAVPSILFTGICIGYFSVFPENLKLRAIFLALAVLAFSGSLYSSAYGIDQFQDGNINYRNQDTRLASEILSKLPEERSLLIVSNFNTMFLFKTINQNELHEISSFNHLENILTKDIDSMFYTHNLKNVNSTYPFVVEIDKPTFFLRDDACENYYFPILPFLCDAILERYGSELVYEDWGTKLFRITGK